MHKSPSPKHFDPKKHKKVLKIKNKYIMFLVKTYIS